MTHMDGDKIVLYGLGREHHLTNLARCPLIAASKYLHQAAERSIRNDLRKERLDFGDDVLVDPICERRLEDVAEGQVVSLLLK
jgi:hypothetical protein